MELRCVQKVVFSVSGSAVVVETDTGNDEKVNIFSKELKNELNHRRKGTLNETSFSIFPENTR